MPTLNDILILLPEFYLVAAACLLLLLDAFMKAEQALWWPIVRKITPQK